ncbi:branched-chain amino acid transport system permease protein [Mesorhizobium sp. YL-MeA3-2017]|uniref:branched-chain amino acid ABC transporter permease n=1 Tax=Mesorhizobium sp. YL-MeA3-2017 TaxID=3042284 RepID=UPI0015CBD794|nr:branched-chain amino acid ABC transporter permease [Mesorhizobium sp. YL-MeA3-2017]MDQ0332964.1 branched-chain amino acid transport system permease protein [Mesorhizobium sp. YL-MeA3-2017]
MIVLRDILLSALTLGALYAASSVALSLIWGSIGMLNLAHGAYLAVGAYGSLILVNWLGFPWWAGIIGGVVGGMLMGLATHFLLVRWVFAKPNFEINIIILTMALSTIVIDLINNLIGPTSARQPFNIDGRIDIGGSGIAYQTLLIIGGCAIMIFGLQLVIRKTKLGRAIRAVSQEPTAARLNGIPLQVVVLKVMLLAGAVAGISGVLLTAFTTVYPTVGLDPLLKALIICVVGGLGSIPGALSAAFLLAFVEVLVQYGFGTKWGFPALLIAVVIVLIVRPDGLFGQRVQARN